MILPVDYVLQLKAQLATSSIIAAFTIVEEKVWPEKGYVRIRMILSNGDFVEAAEYFVLEDDGLGTRRYRYQWMDGERRDLRKRWDNVEHYPNLPNFPHHVHIGQGNIEPGKRLNIVQLVDALTHEILNEER